MPSLRFSKSARLTRPGEFARLKREGVTFHGKHMVLSVLKNSSGAETRAGFVTSRRVGNAVVRNRVRRRLREIVRVAQPEIVDGVWFALIARQAAALASFAALREEWQMLARRAAIFLPCP